MIATLDAECRREIAEPVAGTAGIMFKRSSLILRCSLPLLALAACQRNSHSSDSAETRFRSNGVAADDPEARELRFTKPPNIRAWDTSATALMVEIALRDSVAHIAFKETGARRSLATGVRLAVNRGTIDAGLALLRSRGVLILGVYRDIALVRVRIDGATAAALSRHPLIDFIEPAQAR